MARDRGNARPATESHGAIKRSRHEDPGAGVGSLIRLRRRTAGLTQRELADLAQVSVGAVRDLEQGRTHRPAPGSLAKLAEALGLDATRLQTLARGIPEPAGRNGRRAGGRPRGPGGSRGLASRSGFPCHRLAECRPGPVLAVRAAVPVAFEAAAVAAEMPN